MKVNLPEAIQWTDWRVDTEKSKWVGEVMFRDPGVSLLIRITQRDVGDPSVFVYWESKDILGGKKILLVS